MPPTQPPSTDQSTVSPSSYQLPPVAPAKPTHRTLWVVIGVIVLLILIGAALYFFTPLKNYLMGRLVTTSVPAELGTAVFLSDVGSANTMIYRFPATGKTAEDAGAIVISAMQSANGSARITRTTDGMFTVSLDSKTILKQKTPMIGIDRAPNGTSVVFAVASSTGKMFVSPSDVPTLPLDSKNWNAIMYTPATNTTTRLGTGASPFFIDQTHIAWISPAGLAVIDLTTRKSTVLVPELNVRISSETLVSPDHSIVAWYDGIGAKTLVPYKVTATSAQALTKTTLTAPHSIILGNDSFYEITAANGAIQILKQPFGGAASAVGQLPIELKISRILFGSI